MLLVHSRPERGCNLAVTYREYDAVAAQGREPGREARLRHDQAEAVERPGVENKRPEKAGELRLRGRLAEVAGGGLGRRAKALANPVRRRRAATPSRRRPRRPRRPRAPTRSFIAFFVLSTHAEGDPPCSG